MKVTVQEEFGLRCLMQLTRAYFKDMPLSTADIAEAEGISAQLLSKTLGLLKEAGLVQAVRGRNGGFMLSRTPNAIMLDEVMTILGGRLFHSSYCDGHSGVEGDCVHSEACALRPVWVSIELIVSSVLKRISLADLLDSEKAMREAVRRALGDTFEENKGISTQVYSFPERSL